MDTKLIGYLKKEGVEFEEYGHSAVNTVEESKSLKRKIPGLHCKTLFIKDNKGQFYLVGLPAEKRLESKLFRNLFNVKKIRFGTPEELKGKTKLTLGSVSIFGIINIKKEEVKLILDKEVWDSDLVGFHPNVNTATLVLKHKDLKKFYDSLKCEKEVVEL